MEKTHTALLAPTGGIAITRVCLLVGWFVKYVVISGKSTTRIFMKFAWRDRFSASVPTISV